MPSYRLLAALFLAGAIGFVALGFATFEMPASAAQAEECGFLPEEVSAGGRLDYARTEAWGISFVRKEEYWSAISIGLAVAFMGVAFAAARRGRSGAAAGAAVGGGLVALSALCVSCLAPVLSVVGLGLAGTLLAGVPKALIALNTLLLTGWGTLFLSRRLAACPVRTTAAPGSAATPAPATH